MKKTIKYLKKRSSDKLSLTPEYDRAVRLLLSQYKKFEKMLELQEDQLNDFKVEVIKLREAKSIKKFN